MIALIYTVSCAQNQNAAKREEKSFLFPVDVVIICCSAVKVGSGLPGKAGSICGGTPSRICPGDSMWVSGTQNQPTFWGIIHWSIGTFFGDTFGKHPEEPATGVCLIS